ncbi:hypothetical protein G6F65_020764 [Rhizopus arrhizus]|nr:hypothetical protein G6F65_020764 [Rhizopus arrhizus]
MPPMRHRRLQLGHGGGAEGIAGGQHQAVAVVLEAFGQLADGGGLADAVDTDGEHHEGLGVAIDHQRLGHRLQDRDQFAAQRGQQRIGVGEFARLHALAQALYQVGGGTHADVGGRRSCVR